MCAPRSGETPARIAIEENGVTYFADPDGRAEIRLVLRSAGNRAFIARLAQGARVLDAYCYTGGFGMLAAGGRGASRRGVDSSRAALALARRSRRRQWC